MESGRVLTFPDISFIHKLNFGISFEIFSRSCFGVKDRGHPWCVTEGRVRGGGWGYLKCTPGNSGLGWTNINSGRSAVDFIDRVSSCLIYPNIKTAGSWNPYHLPVQIP